MDKRGQIFLYIIVGFVILLIAGLGFYFHKNGFQLPFGQLRKIFLEVDNNIKSCLDKTVVDGIYFTGSQGGYYKSNVKKYNYLGYNVPYYFYKGRYAVPDNAFVSSEISDYINDNLYDCINFDSLESKGFIFNKSGVTSSVKMNEKDMLINIDSGIKVSLGSSSTGFDNYEKYVDFNYFNVLNTSRTVLVYGNNSIPMGFLSGLSYDKNFKFDVITLTNDTVLYIFYFDNKLREEPFRFTFAARYGWD